jgi:hypothetical protein
VPQYNNSAKIPLLITHTQDEDEYVLLASLDLSFAFDVVNIELLLKRLKIIGIPKDVIDLISVWLSNTSFYVSIDGLNSIIFDLLLGAVQWSILGPILYAILVSKLFDLYDLSADDIFIPICNKKLPVLICNIEKKL